VKATAHVMSRCQCPMRILGHSAPSIQLLISAQCILFACLHHLLPCLSFFFTF